MSPRGGLARSALAAALLAAPLVGCTGPSAGGTAPPTHDDALRIRNDALASARVWREPDPAVAEADLRRNPTGDLPIQPGDVVECRFSMRKVGGTTPKFHCHLPTGEEVKVKYGRGNPELAAEVAATRLLRALGFGADRIYRVRAVRCAGCPPYPFHALRCFQRTGIESGCFTGGLDPSRVVTFEPAIIERKLPGRAIEAVEDQGWAWYELAAIDSARGGASREELDAFRLLAVFLAHWDNKAGNQRLICPPGEELPDGRCGRPFAIIQDAGATFGPSKLDLHNWRHGRIWADPKRCVVSMKHLPWGGGTFPDAAISEPGRRLLLRLLEQLSDAQVRDLFESSGAADHDQVSAEARDPDNWVRAFNARVQQIRDGGPCS